MDLNTASLLAIELMKKHIPMSESNDWSFRFDGAKRRFGSCHRRAKVITLSRHLTALNTEQDVRTTILHEIAHALTPTDKGHGILWSSKCIDLGIKATRCYDPKKVTSPKPRLYLNCPVFDCATSVPRYRGKRRNTNYTCNKHGQPLEQSYTAKAQPTQLPSKEVAVTEIIPPTLMPTPLPVPPSPITPAVEPTPIPPQEVKPRVIWPS